MNKIYPVIIIGGGPVGLAAAAHLCQRDMDFLLLELGSRVGDSVAEWGHVEMFSSWSLNTDPVAVQMLSSASWKRNDPDKFPTGHDLVEKYLEPLSRLPQIAPRILLNRKVRNVSRQQGKRFTNRSSSPFVLNTFNIETQETERFYANQVIDASGTWKSPSPLGGFGYEIQGEENEKIATGIPSVLDSHRETYLGKDTVVIGSGHSAIAVLNDLVELKRQAGNGKVTWIVRSDKTEGGACKPAILPGRGELESGARSLYEKNEIRLINNFYAQSISEKSDGKLFINGIREGRKSLVETDRIVATTGCRPDITMTRELQLQYDHLFECPVGVSELIVAAGARGEAIPAPHGYKAVLHPEPGYYVVGMKSHGRAQNFFLMSGYEQVRSVCAYVCGDIEAANKVEFEYPEDGVCGGACAEGSCCGPATVDVSGAAAACGAGGCCG